MADGRDYVIKVRDPRLNPTPVSIGPFDVRIAVDVPAGFDGMDPAVVAAHVIAYVTPLVPASVTSEQWASFSDAVCSWASAHRDAAARVEWEQERHQFAWQPFEIWQTNGSIVGLASSDERARRKLDRDATLLHTVYGETWEEAMAIIRKHYAIAHCIRLGDE